MAGMIVATWPSATMARPRTHRLGLDKQAPNFPRCYFEGTGWSHIDPLPVHIAIGLLFLISSWWTEEEETVFLVGHCHLWGSDELSRAAAIFTSPGNLQGSGLCRTKKRGGLPACL
jgi:hypothetical protein